MESEERLGMAADLIRTLARMQRRLKELKSLQIELNIRKGAAKRDLESLLIRATPEEQKLIEKLIRARAKKCPFPMDKHLWNSLLMPDVNDA